jgi:DNA-binding CsgD family transcriptional regulator
MTQPSAHVEGGPDPGTAALNPRDLRLLGYLAEGRSTAQIASALSVSGNTARTRIRRVQRKLRVTDRAAAVHAARDFGVVRSPVLACRP